MWSRTYLFSLRQSAREAVEDEAVLARRRVDGVPDELDHQLIGHELAALHDRTGDLTKRRVGSHGGAQHIASGEVADRLALALGLDLLGLGSLTRGGRANENDAMRPAEGGGHVA